MKNTLLLCALAAGIAGCASGPDYRRPDLALTPEYRSPMPAADARRSAGLDAWWLGFDDPLLAELVGRVFQQNLDLAQAQARLQQSRAAALGAGAELMPRVDLGASAAEVRQSLLSPIGGLARRLPGFERNYAEYAVGASASWELDLFGGTHRRQEQAQALAAAESARADGIRTSLAAEAADTYLLMRELQARIGIARDQERTQRALRDLVDRRLQQGLSSTRDLLQGEAALHGVQAAIPPLLAQLEAQWNRLDVLMGAQPGSYRHAFEAVAPLPVAPLPATAQTPGELLRRRPDVIAAEQRLVAANAGIGAALSEYYPKLSLGALLGWQSTVGSRLLSADALQGQLGGGLRWRLFDFGRVDAEVAQARGREAEALAAYRATVLRATEEVENTLSRLARTQDAVQSLDQEVDRLVQARRLAQLAFDGGAISLLEVRDTDRALLSASDRLAQARSETARSAVQLFRVLGGGWEPAAPPPAGDRERPGALAAR